MRRCMRLLVSAACERCCCVPRRLLRLWWSDQPQGGHRVYRAHRFYSAAQLKIGKVRQVSQGACHGSARSAADGDVDHPRVAFLAVKLVARIRQVAHHRRQHPRLVALAALGRQGSAQETGSGAGGGSRRWLRLQLPACAAIWPSLHVSARAGNPPVPPHAGDDLQQHPPGVAQPAKGH